MKRVVCLGARSFLLGFITRHTSERVLPHGQTTCGFLMSPLQTWFDGWWISSCGNSGLAIDQLHHAHRTCGSTEYMPSSVSRFTSMLLSTFDFRRRVSSCPRGVHSLPLPCFTGISYAPTRRTLPSTLSIPRPRLLNRTRLALPTQTRLAA